MVNIFINKELVLNSYRVERNTATWQGWEAYSRFNNQQDDFKWGNIALRQGNCIFFLR
jgi:hypothetical protein